jgi:hypothetical protein
MERPEIFVIVQGFYYDQPGEYCEAWSYDLSLIDNERIRGRGKTPELAQDALYHAIKQALPEIEFVRGTGDRRRYPEVLSPPEQSSQELPGEVYESILAEIPPLLKNDNTARLRRLFARIVSDGSTTQMWDALARMLATDRPPKGV